MREHRRDCIRARVSAVSSVAAATVVTVWKAKRDTKSRDCCHAGATVTVVKASLCPAPAVWRAHRFSLSLSPSVYLYQPPSVLCVLLSSPIPLPPPHKKLADITHYYGKYCSKMTAGILMSIRKCKHSRTKVRKRLVDRQNVNVSPTFIPVNSLSLSHHHTR